MSPKELPSRKKPPAELRDVGLLIIGSEILQGFVRDSNTQFITSSLFGLGITVSEVCAIPDDRQLIKKNLKRLLSQGLFVITTGGLGPTDDDLTVDVICDLFKLKTETEKKCARRVEKLVLARGGNISLKKRVMRQCRIPEGSIALENQAGLAPGIFLRVPGIICLPGFPEEIKSIWPHALKKIRQEARHKFFSEIITIWGIPESRVYENVAIPEGVTFGNHALPWGNRYFLRTSDKISMAKVARKLRREYAPWVLENPVEECFRWFLKNKLTFGTVESCTGGLAAKLMTDIPGASAVFWGSLVTYANDEKTRLAGVSPETIEKNGAVSAETALEMARGGAARLETDITVSITGIAGPGGGSEEKPVGTVYFGIHDRRSGRTYCGKGFFPFGRERFRNAVVYFVYMALYHRYVYYGDEMKWLSSPEGKNFILSGNAGFTGYQNS